MEWHWDAEAAWWVGGAVEEALAVFYMGDK